MNIVRRVLTGIRRLDPQVIVGGDRVVDHGEANRRIADEYGQHGRQRVFGAGVLKLGAKILDIDRPGRLRRP